MNTKEEKQDRLHEAIKLCEVHCERMDFAHKKLKQYFPLTKEAYLEMPPEDLSYFDQLIFRFSKLQDSMGNKLFTALLDNLEEETRGVPFLDILGKLESLNFLRDKNIWIQLRETRNIVTHEYPFITEAVVDGLNLLDEHSRLLTEIWGDMKEKIQARF